MATKTKVDPETEIDPEVEEATGIDPEADAEVDPQEWDSMAADLEGKSALDALIKAAVEAEVKAILADAAKQKAQEESKPPLAMKANIGDRFATDSNARGSTDPWIKHYRCDRAMSEKTVEYDMELMDRYEAGELERPTHEGKPNRKVSILDLCVIPGQWINWMNGHCYAFTENQVRNIDRLQDLARAGKPGGMEGIYEDVGTVSMWPCPVCQNLPAFLDKQTYANHMWAVHQLAAPI